MKYKIILTILLILILIGAYLYFNEPSTPPPQQNQGIQIN